MHRIIAEAGHCGSDSQQEPPLYELLEYLLEVVSVHLSTASCNACLLFGREQQGMCIGCERMSHISCICKAGSVLRVADSSTYFAMHCNPDTHEVYQMQPAPAMSFAPL